MLNCILASVEISFGTTRARVRLSTWGIVKRMSLVPLVRPALGTSVSVLISKVASFQE